MSSSEASASASTQLVTTVNPQSKSHLAQAPNEIIPIIMSFLGFEEDMGSLAKTCHLMYKLNLLPNNKYPNWYLKYDKQLELRLSLANKAGRVIQRHLRKNDTGDCLYGPPTHNEDRRYLSVLAKFAALDFLKRHLQKTTTDDLATELATKICENRFAYFFLYRDLDTATKITIENKKLRALIIFTAVMATTAQSGTLPQQLPPKIMARLSKYDNFAPNQSFRSEQARTLSALEVIILHDLMHLSPGKLLLINHEFTSRVKSRIEELESKLNPADITNIANILNLNPSIPQDQSSDLRNNHSRTTGPLLKEYNKPQTMIDLLLMPDENWNIFITKIVEILSINPQELADFIFGPILDDKKAHEPGSSYERLFGNHPGAALRVGPHATTKTAKNKPNRKTRKVIQQFLSFMRTLLASNNSSMANKMTLLYALLPEKWIELTIGAYTFYKDLSTYPHGVRLHEIPLKALKDLGEIVLDEKTKHGTLPDEISARFKRNLIEDSGSIYKNFRLIAEQHKSEIYTLKLGYLELSPYAQEYLISLMPLFKEAKQEYPIEFLKRPGDFQWHGELVEYDNWLSLLQDNKKSISSLIDELLPPLDDDASEEEQQAYAEEKLSFWVFLTENFSFANLNKRRSDLATLKGSAGNAEAIQKYENIILVCDLMHLFSPKGIYLKDETDIRIRSTPDRCHTQKIMELIAKTGIRRINALQSIYSQHLMLGSTEFDFSSVFDDTESGDNSSSQAAASTTGEAESTKASGVDLSEAVEVIDEKFKNKMSLIYSGRLNGSTDCLWEILHKTIISFVHKRDSLYQVYNQMLGNPSSMQEFETLVFQNTEGPVPVETAITNLLDKHFHDLQMAINKRRAETSQKQTVVSAGGAGASSSGAGAGASSSEARPAKRARTSQAQTVFEGGAGASSAGTSSSAAGGAAMDMGQ